MKYQNSDLDARPENLNMFLKPNPMAWPNDTFFVSITFEFNWFCCKSMEGLTGSEICCATLSSHFCSGKISSTQDGESFSFTRILRMRRLSFEIDKQSAITTELTPAATRAQYIRSDSDNDEDSLFILRNIGEKAVSILREIDIRSSNEKRLSRLR